MVIVPGGGTTSSEDEGATRDEDTRGECKASDGAATVEEEAAMTVEAGVPKPAGGIAEDEEEVAVVIGGGLTENGEGPCEVGAAALRARGAT